MAAAAACLLFACLPADPSAADRSRDLDIDFGDVTLRRIAELQDRMASDSLLAYFDDAEPERRYLAARAFGSLRDSGAVAPLIGLLADPILEVRTVAAYALGQQGTAAAASALTAAFEPLDTAGFYAPFHRALLEAVGKTGDTSDLRALTAVDTYLPTDTSLQVGRLQAIYRMALRGITSEAGTAAAVAAASDAELPAAARLYGAHYAARADADLAAYGPRLRATLTPGLLGARGDTSARRPRGGALAGARQNRGHRPRRGAAPPLRRRGGRAHARSAPPLGGRALGWVAVSRAAATAGG